MALVEMFMPKMGESIMEGTILKWLKKPGDIIEEDESVLEVATDKVDTEIPTPQAGVLKEILAKEGDVVQVGKTIAIISTDGEENVIDDKVKIEEKERVDEQASKTITTPPRIELSPTYKGEVVAQTDDGSMKLEKPVSGRFYSPLVKNIARQEKIPINELDNIPGSGKEGRVSKKDILSYVENRMAVSTEVPTLTPGGVEFTTGDKIIEMDRVRKMIAERMVESKRISPHVTSFVETDVSNLVIWRNKYKNEFEKREGEKITFTPIFIEAIVKAIKDLPMVNVSVDGSKIIVHNEINIGLAVALPSGNLIVPVIKNADRYNLTGLAKKVNDLTKRARENKLKLDDLTDGTYTISNLGTFGNVMGTPIIMQPQTAIMAVGAIQKKPAVIETPQGDTIGIRYMMFLSHAYDHRVIDGALGGGFVKKVADYLEGFDGNRSF